MGSRENPVLRREHRWEGTKEEDDRGTPGRHEGNRTCVGEDRTPDRVGSTTVVYVEVPVREGSTSRQDLQEKSQEGEGVEIRKSIMNRVPYA